MGFKEWKKGKFFHKRKPRAWL